MKNTLKYVYFAGLLIAVVAALAGFANQWLSLLLALVGIVLGIFYFDSNDVVNFGVRFILFSFVYNALGAVPYIGTYLSTIFGAVLAFLYPVALTVLVMYFVNKYFMAAPKPAGKKK